MPTREGKPIGATGSFATRDPGYYEEDPRTFWNRLGELFREDPKKLIAKSKNAMAFSEMLDITPSEAYEYHDELGERVFGEREITTPELIGGLILLPITAAIATNPLGLLLGVTTYQAIAEAESAAISLFKNKKYQVFRNRGLTDLLPEDTAEVTREIVDTFDMVGKMVAAGGVFKTAPRLGNKIARKIMVENRLPREIYISGKDLKADLQTGGILPQEAAEIYRGLGLQHRQVVEALRKGLNIKVPAEKIITITDKPWYAKLKKLFRISPYEEVRFPGETKPTYEFAIKPAEKPPVVEEVVKAPPVRRLELETFDRKVFNAIEGKEHMFLEEAKGTYHTIVEEGESIGIVGYEGGKKEPFATIGILEEFRGKGYLAKAYESLAEEHGLNHLYVDIEKTNEKSIEAHRDFGFKEVVGKGPEKKLFETDVRMYKDMVEVVSLEKIREKKEEIRKGAEEEEITGKITGIFEQDRFGEIPPEQVAANFSVLHGKARPGDSDEKLIADVLEALLPSVERRTHNKIIVEYPTGVETDATYLLTVSKIKDIHEYVRESPRMKKLKEDPELSDVANTIDNAFQNILEEKFVDNYYLFDTKEACLVWDEEAPGKPHFKVDITKVAKPEKILREKLPTEVEEAVKRPELTIGKAFDTFVDSFVSKLEAGRSIGTSQERSLVLKRYYTLLDKESFTRIFHQTALKQMDNDMIERLFHRAGLEEFQWEELTEEQVFELATELMDSRELEGESTKEIKIDFVNKLREITKKGKYGILEEEVLTDRRADWTAEDFLEALEEAVGKMKQVSKFERFLETLPSKQRRGKKLEGVKRVLDLIETDYPEIGDKITRVLYAPLTGRHGETMGGVITLSTVDVPTLGHEIGELLQPVAQFGRGKTITGKEAVDRDNLSDAIAYVLTEESGLKTPRKSPPPELLDKARELISGEKPEIPSPNISDITEEAARGIKNAKTRIRLVTGQTKISDLVREDVALVASLRRAAREARHAMSVGKKEGYEKAKQHYLDLREKAKKRIAQKKYVQELINNITKPLGNIDFFYKEGIENLREGIDPHFRAKKSVQAKERMQRFFKENPDRLAEMPTKFMEELSKKPLNDYTIDDIQQISDKIESLRKLGRIKRKLTLAQRGREFEKTRDKIVTTISRGKKIEEEIPVIRATRQKARKRAVARALTLRPARIFDKLDRGQRFSGPMHKFFYDEVNRTVDEAYRITDTRLAGSAAKRKELGLSARDILKSRKVDKLKFTVDEMLDIYAGWKNPRKKLALMYGNNITEEMATKIFASLTTKEKQFADWIISEYGKNYSRVREAHIEYANEDMGWEPFYTPIRRMDITPNKYKSEIAEEILVRSNLKKAYVGKQFTIERKNIPREFQNPVHLGLYNTWLDQVPKQERYIHSGMKVKELQKLTSDPDFRQAVVENFGREYLKRLENYNNRVANPQIYKALDEVGKLSQNLRKNMVIAYLSYNLVTMGKQLPSVLLYLPECGPAHLIAAGLQFAVNPLKVMRFVNEKDPQVKHRMIERELEEMKYSGRIMKKVGRFGMKGIKGMDRTAVTIGWLATYQKNVGKLGGEEATRLAQDATLRTQPAAHAKDLPELYTTNEMLNWVLQFTNQLNQIYNIATYDIPRDVRRGRVYKAFLSSLALAMVSLTIYAISNRRLPEDLDDVKEALKEEAIMAIPLIGRTIMAASKGWESPSPALKLAVAAGKLISGAERATKAKAVLEGVLVALGVPYTGPRRVKKAIEEGPIELLGPEKPKKRGRRRYR